MVLCYLKHYETLDKMKETFRISKAYLHTILPKTIEVITRCRNFVSFLE